MLFWRNLFNIGFVDIYSTAKFLILEDIANLPAKLTDTGFGLVFELEQTYASKVFTKSKGSDILQ